MHRGDCVVLRSPSPPPEVLVRRIVALEGDEMVSDLPGDQPFVCVLRCGSPLCVVWAQGVGH